MTSGGQKFQFNAVRVVPCLYYYCLLVEEVQPYPKSKIIVLLEFVLALKFAFLLCGLNAPGIDFYE